MSAIHSNILPQSIKNEVALNGGNFNFTRHDYGVNLKGIFKLRIKQGDIGKLLGSWSRGRGVISSECWLKGLIGGCTFMCPLFVQVNITT